MRRTLLAILTLVIGAILAAAVWLWTPPAREFDRDAALRTGGDYAARIIRDRFGVPHIYGVRNADVAFGLAYAHARDDWAPFEEVIRFSRGELARATGRDGAVTDYLMAALGVASAIEERYAADIAPATKAILEGYAAGINYFCAEERRRCAPDIAPVTAKDIVAGFVARTPFFYGIDDTLTALFDGAPEEATDSATRAAYCRLVPGAEFGSNAMAVAPSRSADGHTRLLVNSHQPYTGPVAWYEARLKSEEGWDAIGGLFPGAPLILHGTRPELGWAFTVNKPDLVDVYALVVDDEDAPTRYRFEGEWRDFERRDARFRFRLFGPFSLPVTRPVLRSVHGPAFKTPAGWMSVAFAGDGDIRAVEQWRRLNFARDYDEFRAAFELQGIPSFNVVYADAQGAVAYHYNAAIPVRAAGFDWSKPLPGDSAGALWSGVRPFAAVPSVVNPASGFVGNANNTPFLVAAEGDAPDPDAFPPEFGIDRRTTNRGARMRALYFRDREITREEFIAYKMDHTYAPDSRLARLIRILIEDPALAADEGMQPALDVLAGWDLSASADSRGAALAILTGQKALGYTLGGEGASHPDPVDALKETAEELLAGFGRLDPEWGEVNRLVRGEVSLPLNGGPDTLRAVYGVGEPKEGPLTASFGDTYIMSVDWAPDGTQTVQTIHQFGAATLDEDSPHYADQAPLFARGEWKTPPMALDDLLKEATADVRLGGGAGGR